MAKFLENRHISNLINMSCKVIDGAINNMIQITRYYCFHHQYLILELWIRLKHFSFTTEYY